MQHLPTPYLQKVGAASAFIQVPYGVVNARIAFGNPYSDPQT